MHNATRILVNYPDLPGFSRAREQGNYLKLELSLTGMLYMFVTWSLSRNWTAVLVYY